MSSHTMYKIKQQQQQDHQALLKAKYCPQVAAALCPPPKTHVTLTFDLETE